MSGAENPKCLACGGPTAYLGTMVHMAYYRCQNCKLDVMIEEKTIPKKNDGWKKIKPVACDLCGQAACWRHAGGLLRCERCGKGGGG